MPTGYEGPERRQYPDWPCKGVCGDHSGHEQQLTTLSDQMDHLISLPETVAKLTGRMNILILVFSLVGISVLGGVGYTFTAIGFFKDKYSIDREADKKELSELILEIKSANSDFKLVVQKQISELQNSIDTRLDELEKTDAILNATERLKQNSYPNTYGPQKIE